MATIIDDNLSKILSARYGEEVRGAIHDAIEQCYNNVDSDLNMKSNGIKIVRDAESGFDANDLPDNSFTDFIITQSALSFAKNLPSEITSNPVQHEIVFINYGPNINGQHQEIIEIIDGEVHLYFREKQMDSYKPWSSLGTNRVIYDVLNNSKNNTIDLDSVKDYSFNYVLSVPSLDGVDNHNFPEATQFAQEVMGLCNIGVSSNLTIQALITDKNAIYTRSTSNTGHGAVYNDWGKIGRREIFVSPEKKNGYQKGQWYTSLLDGLIDATSDFDNIVYVLPGTYDLVKEYQDHFGSDFFSEYNPDLDEFAKGLVLKNRVTVICARGAEITCNYDGSNRTASDLFSPFNAGPFGFTLIGAEVRDSNVRYSVHDERSTYEDVYVNHYIGCSFYHDKGNGYRQALGGGLGINGNVIIENCMFKSVGVTDEFVLTYHNSLSDGKNARSMVTIKDSIVDGKIRCSYYGNSTAMSEMIVTNCRLLSEPVVTQEVSGYDIQNFKLYAWNNTIESEPILS